MNAVYGYASTGVIVKDLCEELAAAGHEALSVYQHASPLPKNGLCVGNLLDWKWHALYTRLTGKQGYASKRVTNDLLKYLDNEKPDIVHLHNLHSNFINIQLLFDYLKRKKTATVITLHDCWFFTGKCTHFVQFGCNKWMDSCGNCPERNYEVPSILFDNSSFVLKNKCELLNAIPNLTFVGCSDWISNLARKSHIGSKPIITIRNGIDTAIFKPRSSGFREKYDLENKFVILGFSGKWAAPENRLGVKKIIESLEDYDRLVIVGCDEAAKKFFGSSQKAICLPYITDREQLADIYSAADVFVNLTHFDNLPTVNMESVCCGTPVITFDVGGCREMIDNDDGMVVAEGDYEAVIAAMNRIRRAPFEYDVHEKREKFNRVNCYRKYMDLYESMLTHRQ